MCGARRRRALRAAPKIVAPEAVEPRSEVRMPWEVVARR